METQWQYQNDEQTVVGRTNADGSLSSCFVNTPEIQEYLANGGTILPKAT